MVLFIYPKSLFLSFSCVINCGEKVSSSLRLSLSSQCSGSPCGSHEWVLFKHCNGLHCASLPGGNRAPGTGIKIEAVNMTSLTYTPQNASYIVFKENIFAANVRYITGVRTGNNQLVPMAFYQFIVASPPIGGPCNMTPSNGVSLSTDFRIICSNWTADDPLTFIYRYQLENGLYSVLYHGRNSSFSTSLPSGNPSRGHSLNVKATIISLYGSVEVTLTVQVCFDCFLFVVPCYMLSSLNIIIIDFIRVRKLLATQYFTLWPCNLVITCFHSSL